MYIQFHYRLAYWQAAWWIGLWVTGGAVKVHFLNVQKRVYGQRIERMSLKALLRLKLCLDYPVIGKWSVIPASQHLYSTLPYPTLLCSALLYSTLCTKHRRINRINKACFHISNDSYTAKHWFSHRLQHVFVAAVCKCVMCLKELMLPPSPLPTHVH